MITDQQYLSWHQKLSENKLFRRFWVFWGIYSVLTFFVISLYLIIINQWQVVVLLLSAFVLARHIVSPLIFTVYKKARPYQRLQYRTIYSWLMSREKVIHNSFPSDHAISFASITAVLMYYSPTIGWLSVVLVLMSGPARIILGYHDEKDILAGWVLGVLSAWAVIYWLAPIVFQ